MNKKIRWSKGSKEIIASLLINKPKLLIFFKTRSTKYKASIKKLIELWLIQNKKCALCGDELSMDKHTHVDHILPKSKGGKDEIDNYQIVCNKCNYAKRDLSTEEFILLCLKISARYQHKYLSQEEITKIIKNSWRLQSKEASLNDVNEFVIKIKDESGKNIGRKLRKTDGKDWNNIKSILASAGLI